MGRTVTSPSIAETILRLAVLLQAGVAPARAWAYLAETGDEPAQRVCAAADAGVGLSEAIRTGAKAPAPSRGRRSARLTAPEEWDDVAAAWHVATGVGAPLAESLRSLAAALRDKREAADDVRVALAEPAATAKLMGWLPLVAVVLGVALGFDTFATLLGSPFGLGCLVAGGVLIVAAQRWNAALVKKAASDGRIPGLGAELLAIALSGGVSMDRARRLVQDAGGEETDADTEAVLNLSRTAGVPAVELLRASAALARHRARVEGRMRAARLSTRLLLPLGVCTLPAFLLLGVAPMLLSVMGSMPVPF